MSRAAGGSARLLSSAWSTRCAVLCDCCLGVWVSRCFPPSSLSCRPFLSCRSSSCLSFLPFFAWFPSPCHRLGPPPPPPCLGPPPSPPPCLAPPPTPAPHLVPPIPHLAPLPHLALLSRCFPPRRCHFSPFLRSLSPSFSSWSFLSLRRHIRVRLPIIALPLFLLIDSLRRPSSCSIRCHWALAVAGFASSRCAVVVVPVITLIATVGVIVCSQVLRLQVIMSSWQ
jgi:hypothetical protein